VEIVRKQLLLLSGLFLLSGCTWAVRQQTDQSVRDLVDHPFDIAPRGATEAPKPAPAAPLPDRPAAPPAGDRTSDNSAARPQSGAKNPKPQVPEVQIDAKTSAMMEPQPAGARADKPTRDDRVQTVAWTRPEPGPASREAAQAMARQRKLDLHIPPQVPGSEAPLMTLERGAPQREIDRIYPELPPLPVEPTPRKGPGGKPYTLSELQRLAAANSPTLRQAASDVEAAKGNLIQAATYPNPTLSYLVDPSNNNSTAGVQGGAIEQIIITGGKQKLGVAAAQKDLDNAILALKRARSDLATAVRTAYFTLLVDVETLKVTRAIVRFSDDIYRLQVGLVRGAIVAPYEPTALRGQTFINRLAYRQAIASYLYDWKILVATLGLPQLPLSEIAGRVDQFIPYFDYDEIKAYALQHHTDVLSARNVVAKSQYLLKIQQVIPIFPNLDVRWSLEKDFVLGPFGTYQTLALGFPIPIWDQNKGNIIAAQAALLRASEESHRVEVTIASGLATAYEGYRNNLYAMEYYRRYILPDLVRYYRAVFERRQIDPTSAFGDLVFAQQNLTTNVTAYLGILGSLWSSVVSVADYLQTDDLFQLAKPRALPEVPDFKLLHAASWACGHDALAESYGDGVAAGDHPAGAPGADLPAARPSAGPAGSPAGGRAPAPPPAAGAGAAPAVRLQQAQPPAARARVGPAGGPDGDGMARLDRRPDASVGPAAHLTFYFGNDVDRAAQAFKGAQGLAKPYFGTEQNDDARNF
jgi:cobalt-zinc-cadmium efflux system outer membrane protein